MVVVVFPVPVPVLRKKDVENLELSQLAAVSSSRLSYDVTNGNYRGTEKVSLHYLKYFEHVQSSYSPTHFTACVDK